MKYVCWGYYDKGNLDGMTEAERNAMFDTCFEYDTIFAPTGRTADTQNPAPPIPRSQNFKIFLSLSA